MGRSESRCLIVASLGSFLDVIFQIFWHVLKTALIPIWWSGVRCHGRRESIQIPSIQTTTKKKKCWALSFVRGAARKQQVARLLRFFSHSPNPGWISPVAPRAPDLFSTSADQSRRSSWNVNARFIKLWYAAANKADWRLYLEYSFILRVTVWLPRLRSPPSGLLLEKAWQKMLC